MRAKKIQREVVGFWRKRGRELTDLKKRKEKLENEIKKRDEEKKESDLHKKRLAFLMRQSDIYAHFMAKKLGIHTNSEEAVVDPKEMNADLKDVEIDEERAMENVSEIINQQRRHVDLYNSKELIDGEKKHRGAPRVIRDGSRELNGRQRALGEDRAGREQSQR